MSAFDTIEYTRPEFFTTVATADAMLRLGLGDKPEYLEAFKKIEACLKTLESAYEQDMRRMRSIFARVSTGEQVDLYLLDDRD